MTTLAMTSMMSVSLGIEVSCAFLFSRWCFLITLGHSLMMKYKRKHSRATNTAFHQDF